MGESDRTKVKSQEMEEGAGAKVKRLFPTMNLRHYDPFVLIDEFFVDPSAGIPTHPHRGFEGVTYMIQGAFAHKDSLGRDSIVTVGGVQRFTAGRGLTHSEMPYGEEEARGFQLWVNLPKKLKGMEPDYQLVESGEIPVVNYDGITVRTVIGAGSPVQLQTKVLYLDINCEKEGSFHYKLPPENSTFVYLFQGEGRCGEEPLKPGEAVFMRESDVVITTDSSCRFLLLSGLPHGEPIYQRGPFVD